MNRGCIRLIRRRNGTDERLKIADSLGIDSTQTVRVVAGVALVSQPIFLHPFGRLPKRLQFSVESPHPDIQGADLRVVADQSFD
jgi:hypothetical protein